MKKIRLKCRGITLVEAIAALGVMGVLAMVSYTFIMFSSKTLRKITAMQLMQQESSVISEVFMREVRNGEFITLENDSIPPEDSASVGSISVYQEEDTASFCIEDSFFITDCYSTEAKVLSSKIYKAGDNRFKVFKHGDHVEFYFNLYRNVGDEVIYLPLTHGDVRCKN